MLAALEEHCPSRSKVERVRLAMAALQAQGVAAPEAMPLEGPGDASDLRGVAGSARSATSYDLVLATDQRSDAVIPLRAEHSVVDFVLPSSAAPPRAEVRVPPPGATGIGGWRHWTPIRARIIATALANVADPAAAAPHNALLEQGLSSAGMDARSCLVVRYCVEGPPTGAALVLSRTTAT